MINAHTYTCMHTYTHMPPHNSEAFARPLLLQGDRAYSLFNFRFMCTLTYSMLSSPPTLFHFISETFARPSLLQGERAYSLFNFRFMCTHTYSMLSSPPTSFSLIPRDVCAPSLLQGERAY
jgi:hypothetical protein